MLTPANRVLVEFVLDRSGSEPLARRIALYRALASTLSEGDEAFHELTKLADDLESAADRHDQLLLNFRASGSASAKADVEITVTPPTVTILPQPKPRGFLAWLFNFLRTGGRP